MNLRHPDIMPVMYELIEVFKHPPEACAEDEEFEEKSWLVDEHAPAGSGKGEGVDDDDIPEPEQREGVWLPGLKPGKAGPGEYPSESCPPHRSPPPPGKLHKGKGLGCAEATTGPISPKKKSKGSKDKDGQYAKNWPGQRGFSRLCGNRQKGQVGWEALA